MTALPPLPSLTFICGTPSFILLLNTAFTASTLVFPHPRSRKYSASSFQGKDFPAGEANIKSTKWKEGWKPGWRDGSGRYCGVPLLVLREWSGSCLEVRWQWTLTHRAFPVPTPCWAAPRCFWDRRLSTGLRSATLNCPATARQRVIQTDQFYHTGLFSVWLITWKRGHLYQ